MVRNTSTSTLCAHADDFYPTPPQSRGTACSYLNRKGLRKVATRSGLVDIIIGQSLCHGI
eukprot:scaffold150178_cov34-Prasinocladus_malaysianus.AAC.1